MDTQEELKNIHSLLECILKKLNDNQEEIKKNHSLLEFIIKKLEVSTCCPELRRQWIPKREIQNFVGLENTQFTAKAKEIGITSTQIGKKTFYSTSSVLQCMEAAKNK